LRYDRAVGYRQSRCVVKLDSAPDKLTSREIAAAQRFEEEPCAAERSPVNCKPAFDDYSASPGGIADAGTGIERQRVGRVHNTVVIIIKIAAVRCAVTVGVGIGSRRAKHRVLERRGKHHTLGDGQRCSVPHDAVRLRTPVEPEQSVRESRYVRQSRRTVHGTVSRYDPRTFSDKVDVGDGRCRTFTEVLEYERQNCTTLDRTVGDGR